jgi:transposase
MKILSLIAERKQIEAASLEAKRKAINTSSIVAVLDEGKHVALYFTGHPHAGQNLSAVLAKREPGLAIPMQMSDALASNFVGEFATIIGKCIAHGRRRFVDLVPHFPEHCRYVIETLAQVYAHEAHCQAKAMSADQRLRYHQEHSGPPMQAMRDWVGDQFAKSLVEPHGSLGKSLTYLIKHWDGMMLFLRQAGAPLDNNICYAEHGIANDLAGRTPLTACGGILQRAFSGAFSASDPLPSWIGSTLQRQIAKRSGRVPRPAVVG